MLKCSLIGNIGSDAIVNVVNGKTVINLNVCHSEKWQDNTGQLKEKSVWVSCSYWSEKTSIAQYLKKGTQVFIEGGIEAKTYQNNRGETLPQLVCRVSQIQLLGSPQQRTNPTPNPQPQGTGGIDVAQDDPMFEPLPF